MFRRVLAVIFGVVVITAGLVIRADRDEPRAGDASRRGDRPDSAYEVFDDSGLRLLCIEELRKACGETFDLMGFEVNVEPAWVTVDRIERGELLNADVWLTLRPFEQLAQRSAVRPALGPPSPVVARSPIVLAGPTAAVAAVDAACPDVATRMACATAPERARQVALRDPRSSATATLALAAVAYELGTPADATAVSDPAIIEHLRTLTRQGRRSQAPFEDALRIGTPSTALTVEAEAVDVINDLDFDQQEEYDDAGVRYPIDVRAAEVVGVGGPSFRRMDDLVHVLQSDEAGHAFERLGFTTERRVPFAIEAVPAFEGRPVVRTDLPPSAPLLRDIRRIIAT